MKVGDKVHYCVHEIHSKQMVPYTPGDKRSEQFPWVYGWKSGRQVRTSRGDMEFEVQTLTDRQLLKKLNDIKKQPPGIREREAAKLIPLRSQHYWDATVTAISDDGKFVKLDILDPTTGATLHYTVPIDQVKKSAHSCHAKTPAVGPSGEEPAAASEEASDSSEQHE